MLKPNHYTFVSKSSFTRFLRIVYFYFMQDYQISKKFSLKTILLFIIVLIIAFLPVSTFLFFIKNDAFNNYFPPKFFMSESIHAGYLPLWNPYINFGIPQYGDMNSGYWSPITWLIASTVGYNAYTFTIEVLFYILLGGIGMYILSGEWRLDKRVRLIAGIAFMCCGYNIGHLQHFNWLSGAAFLPWCFWSYLRLLQSPSLKRYITAALLFYMLIASAHPGIIIGAVYFFIAVLLFYFLKNDHAASFKTRIKHIGKTNAIFILLLLIVSCGVITGYLDIIPHFVRGEKISLDDSLSHPANIQSWISSLFPFATVKNDSFYNTDISMRNSYFSVTLLLFLLLAIPNKKNSWQKFLFTVGIIFTLLSAGSVFKTFAYHFIPFMGYVRLNGEFRIFPILCFIAIAAIELNRFIQQQKKFEGHIKWIYYAIEIIVIATISFGMYKAFAGKESILYHLQKLNKVNGFALKLKTLIDSLSFYDTLWIQGIIQLIILWAIKWCLKFSNWNLLQKIVIADMIIACLLNIPFTGVGKASVAQVQAVLNKSPKGIPVPPLQSLLQNDSLSIEEENLLGNWSMYNKQIGTRRKMAYPISLKNMNAYFEKSAEDPDAVFTGKPFVFTADTAIRNITVKAFSPNTILLNLRVDTTSTLVLKQNFYPHWYYTTTGTEKKAVDSFGINFMSAPIQRPGGGIILSFEPSRVKYAMLFSLLAFILYCILLLLLKTKQPDPS